MRKKRPVVTALALVLALALAGCSAPRRADVKLYLQGLLDETYLNKTTPEYLDMVEIDQADADAAYQDSLSAEAAYFAAYFDLGGLDEADAQQVTDLCAQVLQHAKYEVVSAALQEDGSYSVKVSVEPIDFIQRVRARCPADAGDGADWTDQLLDLCGALLPGTGNGDAQELTVQLERDDDNCYALTGEDFARLDAAILDYSGAPRAGA